MKALSCYTGTAILFLATIYFQTTLLNSRFSYSFDNPQCPWCNSNQTDEVQFIPAKTVFIRMFAPADPDLTADFLWLRTQYYFGAHAVTDQDYFFLTYLLNKVTDLSAKWEQPYITGAIILYLEAKLPNQALVLLRKGESNIKDSWMIPFLKGYIYWKAFEDLEKASEQIFKASRIEGAPGYLSALSATLASRTGNRAFMATFYDILETYLDDPAQKQRIRQKLKGE